MTKYSEDIFYTDLHLDIIEELGEVYAWEISYKLAGQKIYIPKHKSIEEHPQLSILSKELGEFLQNRYSGERIIIPMGSNSDYLRKKIQSIGLIQSGDGHNEVAIKLGVSHSTARRYKKYVAKNSKTEEKN